MHVVFMSVVIATGSIAYGQDDIIAEPAPAAATAPELAHAPELAPDDHSSYLKAAGDYCYVLSGEAMITGRTYSIEGNQCINLIEAKYGLGVVKSINVTTTKGDQIFLDKKDKKVATLSLSNINMPFAISKRGVMSWGGDSSHGSCDYPVSNGVVGFDCVGHFYDNNERITMRYTLVPKETKDA